MSNDDPVRRIRAQAEAWLDGAASPAAEAHVQRSRDELERELSVSRVEVEMLGAALRQAQIDLDEANRRYADYFEHAPVGLLTLTRSGLVAEANVSAAMLLGVVRKDLLDESFDRFVADVDRDAWHGLFAEGLAPGGQAAGELTLCQGEAAPASRRVQVHCRRAETGAGPALLLTLTDVSGRQATEDMLRKLSLAVEQSPESIVITNLAGDIEYVNDSFVRIAGYARESLIGRNMSLLQSGKTPPAVYAQMWQTLKLGRTWHGRFTNRREDGSEYVESAIITPLREPSGRVTHYVAVKEIIRGKRRERRSTRTPPDGLV